MESNFLQKRLGVQGQKIVLHSGGFGKWFKCKELADSTYNWDKNVKLVFMLVTELKMINILRKSMSLIIEEKSCFL